MNEAGPHHSFLSQKGRDIVCGHPRYMKQGVDARGHRWLIIRLTIDCRKKYFLSLYLLAHVISSGIHQRGGMHG
jgi:hypothetical protein